MGVEKLEPSTNHQNHRVITHTNHLIAINSNTEIVKASLEVLLTAQQ